MAATNGIQRDTVLTLTGRNSWGLDLQGRCSVQKGAEKAREGPFRSKKEGGEVRSVPRLSCRVPNSANTGKKSDAPCGGNDG